MGRTQRSKGDAKLTLPRCEIRRILQDGLYQSAPFFFRPFIVGANHLHQITLDLESNHFQNVGQVLAFGRQFHYLLALSCLDQGQVSGKRSPPCL